MVFVENNKQTTTNNNMVDYFVSLFHWLWLLVLCFVIVRVIVVVVAVIVVIVIIVVIVVVIVIVIVVVVAVVLLLLSLSSFLGSFFVVVCGSWGALGHEPGEHMKQQTISKQQATNNKQHMKQHTTHIITYQTTNNV